jgi:hypothetical protein
VKVARVARPVRRFGVLGVVVLLGAAVLVGSAVAVPTSDKPDLVPLLPTETGTQQAVAPIYTDTYVRPGRVLYRFSSVIKNLGGAMDLYKDPNTGAAMQVVWPGGNPTTMPDPNLVPTGGTTENLTAEHGAYFIFNPSQGHNHWHFQQAAQYQLVLPGGVIRYSDKVGFCMWDSWVKDGAGSTKYFPVNYKGVGPQGWCAPKDPSATFTRMGISRNYGDLYAAQSTDQWVDIGGLRPGDYKVRAIVNPNGFIDESDPSNNTLTVTRTIPGTIATARTVAIAQNKAKTFQVSGKVIAPDVPGRNSLAVGAPGCSDVRTDIGCYVFTTANGPLTFAIAQQPAHGTVSIVSANGLKGSLKYTPNAGYTGPDTLRFTVSDARNLTSLPATVTLNIS